MIVSERAFSLQRRTTLFYMSNVVATSKPCSFDARDEYDVISTSYTFSFKNLFKTEIQYRVLPNG